MTTQNIETFITKRLNNGTLSTDNFLYICSLPKLKKQYFNMLLHARFDMTATNQQGENALFKAAESGNLVLLRSLLKYGLNPMQQDESGEIPLAVAIRCGNLSVANCLLGITKNPALIVDKEGATLLHKAAWGDMPSITCELLDKHGIDIEFKDNFGRTAVHIAAYQSSCKMLKYLLVEKQANVNAIDHESRTPLFSGAYDGNNRVLKILCECGADLSVKDKNGMTALDFAFSKNEFETVKFLKKQAAANHFTIR